MSTKTLDSGSLQIQANRLALVGRLADDLAHEIKNPLHAMVINLELLRRRVAGGAADAALERLAVVESEVGRVHELIEALLRLLRPEHESRVVAELDQVLGEIVPLLRVQARLHRSDLVYQPAGDGATVLISRRALKQIVLNLVANSLAALAPTGGRIELLCSRESTAVRVRVRDTGPGLAGDDAVRDAAGGLGLPVSRSLAAAAGGSLDLEDAGGDGRGATFSLTLPASAGA